MLKRLVLAAALLSGAASPAWGQRTPPALADRDAFGDAARAAYAYVEANYNPSTGWINSVEGYPFATVWDIGSGLLALFCADQLDLLDGDEYDRRMRRALQSLIDARLFQDAAFNKNYSTATGQIAGRAGQEAETSERGYGWSVLDIGRLLVALRVIDSNQPQYRDLVTQVVGRLNYDRLIADGYLRGEDLGSRSRIRRYQEGRIGYEQYAAAGFQAWGRTAHHALNVRQNARDVTVLGIPLLGDVRPDHHLTSDPFVMLGLELGWSGEMRELAWRVLAAQEARWRQTGTVTMVNEDALSGPPYFLYYSVWADGREFRVEAPAGAPNGPTPRTVSTKAAYGWHALLPSGYTWTAVQRVAGARTERGWGAGVFETDGRISGQPNVNTTALVLEAALYVQRGRPLVEPPPAPPAPPAATPAAQ
ncbi:MAG TPA: DUF3131 domain-containing protein [Longimicrobium sp.]